MIIGNIIIKRSKTIRKNLKKYKIISDSQKWLRVLEIYECRIFGLCIYRNEISFQKAKNKILNENSEPAGQ